MLEIKNLDLAFEQKVIYKNVSLEVKEGEIYALLGRNGTGKSTLAGVIVGTIAPDAGKIFFRGDPIDGLSITDRAKKGIILGWQKNVVIQGLTIKDYLQISSPDKLTDKELGSLIEDVGLKACDYMDRLLDNTLSGGERKRIELASVLAARPRLAILDEPDSGIDAVSLKMIVGVIRKIADQGSALLVTHQEDIIRIADRAGLLCGAELLKQGRPEEIIDFFKKNCDSCDTVNIPKPQKLAGEA